jgi:enterochelin esterase family protein
VLPDRRIVFRILAPQAKTVGLRASDIQGLPREGPAFSRNADGVWSATVGPVEPGAYRYTFMVDGAAAMDPRNPASECHAWSLVYVPGAEFMDTANVPHGAVAPSPGYETGGGEYPILYLLHGSGHCDNSWTSVGRAGFILDNLIAAKKAQPMIVAMPAAPSPSDDFAEDFMNDIMPYVEKRNRALTDGQVRVRRRIQCRCFRIRTLAQAFARVGAAARRHAGQRRLETGLEAGVPREPGGHTWINWRNYLNEFAPQLFQ